MLVGSLRSLRREARRTKVETAREFFREIVGTNIDIPLCHPDYHFITVEKELSDPLPMPGCTLYQPNHTYYWQIGDISFQLGTYIGFTVPHINLQLKIKIPTRSELSWDGFLGFLSKKVILPGNGNIKKYYRFRDDLRVSIRENGLLGLCEFPEGWIGYEIK
jgi:hypothetical protein